MSKRERIPTGTESESIGGADVLDVRREGEFIIKVLEPKMPSGPIPVGSSEANEITAAMAPEKDESGKIIKRKRKKIKSPPIPHIRAHEWINNI